MSDLKAELADIAAALEEKTDAVTITSAPQTVFLRHPHTGDTVELEADPAKLVPYMLRGYGQIKSPATPAPKE
jgi:hypothetical protein